MSSSIGPVPPSTEVVLHHDAQHPCPDTTPARLEPCPCGQMALVVCGACGDPVHMAVTPGAWCEHAAALT